MPYALCPMPQATGRLSRNTHEGMEFPVAFYEAMPTVVTELCKGLELFATRLNGDRIPCKLKLLIQLCIWDAIALQTKPNQ
ncbi:hypothetical protein [Nostoc sp. CHAB 5715]|uniref:hypothetical protein n=1 Tax=Nostoc sp. CHAB 5715 TaxID=2780400 RepID=UPI001E3BE4D1|nr:hypothetical protein [Nostoc sp. CHAB 5715]MCC5620780.1 hypothetical protein [Nostoc sp. CHAB 5715]